MTPGWQLFAMLVAPLVAALVAAVVRRPRVAEFANLLASIIALLAVLPLPFQMAALGHPLTYWNGYLLIDSFGAWTSLCTATVWLLASLHSIGYMRAGEHGDQSGARFSAYYVLFALFAFTMLLAPAMNAIGVYWIAIELTTLVSTFLVGWERSPESLEAAWKYIVLVSAGLSLALLGVVLLYWCGSLVLGPTYNMSWNGLTAVATQLNPGLLKLAFLLLLIGFGTKVGLAPMHTWLPDAHSEGPAPVSAMLSGALLNTAMLGIVRMQAITDAAGHGVVPHAVLVILGAFSVLVGALFIVRQKGVKRLMSYSSVEHMGVLALGFGFGGPFGVAGALYHMLMHSLNKSLMFFGAGNAMRRYDTKEISRIRGLLRAFPVTGLLWLGGAVAITGAPPFGLFLSEFTILRGGFASANTWAAWLMLVLLIVIFVGFLNHFRRMAFEPGEPPAQGRPLQMGWMGLPMWIAFVLLLVFGLWWPDGLQRLFTHIAAGLGVRP
jgi:Formate hydrogenlyase subunit 3/Multisubunit Na+/H+ antiporter, MnhD subunit